MAVTWFFCLLCLLQNAETPATPQSQPTTAPIPPANNGPMRMELMGITEKRISMTYPTGAVEKPELRVHIRLVGERVGEVVRIGRVILSEMVDNLGNSMIGPKTYKDEDRTITVPVKIPPDRIKQSGLAQMLLLELPTRQATQIQKAKGTLRVAYANKQEDITIENPMQYQGKKIENKRLAELGIEINVLPPGNPVRTPASSVCLELVKKPECVRDAIFYDAWMKQLRTRTQQGEATSNDGKPCLIYQLMEGPLAADSQMILQVYPQVEEAVIPIEFNNVKLP